MNLKKQLRCLLTLMALLVPILRAAAQEFPIDSVTGKVRYTNVVTLEGVSKSDIYKKAKDWMTSNLKSSDNMVQLDDASHEKLTGTGNLLIERLRLPYFGKVYAEHASLNLKFVVLIKDGRLKYSAENILLTFTDPPNITESGLEDIKPGRSNWTRGMRAKFATTVFEESDKSIKAMIASFIASLNAKADTW